MGTGLSQSGDSTFGLTRSATMRMVDKRPSAIERFELEGHKGGHKRERWEEKYKMEVEWERSVS